MIELVLFILVGALAVVGAVMMLQSNNAVHSALFLVLTMGCIAFLFLLLNAPFLAMIQITVYAGAIMVLFIFVIMLLGAEQAEPELQPGVGVGRYRWFLPLVLTLAFSLLFSIGIGLIQGSINLQGTTEPLPLLRVFNASPDVGTADVYVGDTLVAEAVGYNEPSDYVTLTPGETTLVFDPVEGDPIALDLPLARGTTQTLIAYGEGDDVRLTVIADDTTSVPTERDARFFVFNAYTGAESVELVDFRSEFDETDTVRVVEALEPGEVSEPIIHEEGLIDWAFIPTGDENNVIAPVAEYPVERETASLLVLSTQRIADGTVDGALQPVVLTVVDMVRPAFGGPRAIGYMLFGAYLLPFQLLALLLLAAMVGAIVLTRREVERAKAPVPTGRRVVSRPLVNVIASQVGHDVSAPSDESPQLPPTEAEAAGG